MAARPGRAAVAPCPPATLVPRASPRRAAIRAVLALAILGIAPAPLAAQLRPADPGGHPFRAPAFSPLEPATRGLVASAARDTTDARWLGMPDFGERLPFWLRRDEEGPWELAGSLAAGAFARFDLESSNNEFIEAHYRVGLQLRGRLRGVAGRVEFYHVSSHLGDEYLQRTGRSPISTSREALELLLQAAAGDVLVYGGPGWILRASPRFERGSLRLGAIWEPPVAARAAPYAGLEAYLWEEFGREPMVSVEAGARLGSRLRLGIHAGFGPSRAEQFFRESERLAGLVLTLGP